MGVLRGQGREEGPQGTLKSDSEAISSSSSLVAEEAEMRVCCWLEVTRWGLLISPWFTVMAGLHAGMASAGTPEASPCTPRMSLPSPGDQQLSSDTGVLPLPTPGKPTSSQSLLGTHCWEGLLSASKTEH